MGLTDESQDMADQGTKIRRTFFRSHSMTSFQERALYSHPSTSRFHPIHPYTCLSSMTEEDNDLTLVMMISLSSTHTSDP